MRLSSVATPEFWELYRGLPAVVRTLARKNYQLWQNSTFHPAVRFKRLGGGNWSARVGDHYRAVGKFSPPFNSNRNYEVFWGETKEKRSFEDRHENTRAYIDYMRPRCEQMARVLKKTGSFYYHCDWHASHYVKVMLDEIFGENNFVNEIVWKRQTSHNDAKQGSKHYGRLHDVLLFYCGGSDDYPWNQQSVALDKSYVESHYTQVDETGRRFQWGDLRAPGGAAPSKGNPHYKVLGVDGYWR